MNLISENRLKKYFQDVYKYSKEITKASKEENEKSLKELNDSPFIQATVNDNAGGGTTAATTTTTGVSPANTPTSIGVPAVIDPTATAAPASNADGAAPANSTGGLPAIDPAAVNGGKYTRKKSRKPKYKISKSYKYRVRL